MFIPPINNTRDGFNFVKRIIKTSGSWKNLSTCLIVHHPESIVIQKIFCQKKVFVLIFVKDVPDIYFRYASVSSIT